MLNRWSSRRVTSVRSCRMKITVPPALRAVSVAISVSALCCICPGAFAECCATDGPPRTMRQAARSEEHTSELQSLMRNSYAVFCLKKKKKTKHKHNDLSLNITHTS